MDEDAGVGAIGVLRGQAGTSPVTTMQGARRSWSADEKRRIVEESFRPGASVAVVARRHDLNANLLFTWRRQVRPAGPAAGPPAVAAPEPAEFVPIGVFGSAPDEGPALLATAAPPRAAGVAEVRPPVPHPALEQRPGVIEIDLPGGVRVRVDAFVNERALDRVLRVLKGRA
jgi:transposase